MGDAVETPENDSAGNVVKGLTLMILAMLMVPGIDAFAKYLSATVSPGQIVWARFLFQSLFLAPLVFLRPGPRPTIRRWPLHFGRGVMIAAATLFFYAALQHMPIADAIAVFFVEPFVLTLISVVFLKETIGWRRVAAIVFVFAGAMIVVQPSYAAIGVPALFPLGTAVCFAIYLALTRSLALGEDALAMQLTAGVAACALMTGALILGAEVGIAVLTPVWPTATEWVLMALLGVLATVSHTLIVIAFRHASAGILAPFQYLEIIGATILGLLIFGDFPSPLTWVGVFMIVGSGLYVFYRERRLAQTAVLRRNAQQMDAGV